MSLKTLDLTNSLAPKPSGQPKYPITIKDSQGSEIVCGDPNTTRGLVLLMNMNAVIGGAACHWGGPAALAEIMSAVHAYIFNHASENWFEEFNLINDAGHTENGLYALRANLGYDDLTLTELKKFRSIESKLTGHGEAHLNPEGVYLSNGPLGSTVGQAQGLSLADKATGSARVTYLVVSDGASMEGEAREAFASIPGLAKKNKINPFIMIISDNNTKLGGRIDEDCFDMVPTFESLEHLGWDLRLIQDGHDLEKVYHSLEKATEDVRNHPSKPICLWMKTIKGKGLKDTEESKSGGHGYPLKPGDEKLLDYLTEVFDGNVPMELNDWAKELLKYQPPKKKSDVVKEKAQAGFARAMIKAVNESGLPVFSVSSDLQGSTGVAPFRKEFPERSVELGVAESNMVSVAAGLSKQGFLAVCDTFSQFGVTKGNLPITMANLSLAPVICVFSHTGFQDAADGASHQATAYMAALSAIPHTTVIVVSNSTEAEEYMSQALRHMATEREQGKNPDSVIFFVGRENYAPKYDGDVDYLWERAQILHDSEEADVVLVGCGPMTSKLMRSRKKFLELGISPIIINNPFVNRPDVETIGKALQRSSGRIITMEDHQVIGGMGSMLAHALGQAGHQFQLRSMGIAGEFGRSAYKADELYDSLELNTRGLVETYKTFH